MKWRASKLASKKFSDKLVHEGGDKPINTESQVVVYLPEKAPNE